MVSKEVSLQVNLMKNYKIAYPAATADRGPLAAPNELFVGTQTKAQMRGQNGK